MTFVFDQLGSAVLFLCFLGLLCVCLAGMQQTEEVGPCPRHPNQAHCAHRRKHK